MQQPYVCAFKNCPVTPNNWPHLAQTRKAGSPVLDNSVFFFCLSFFLGGISIK